MFCSKCGKQIDETWVQCPFCGRKVDEDLSIGVHQGVVDGKKKKKKIVIRIIVFMAIIMVALSLFISLFKSEIDKKALKMVQNGYLGNYDIVTVQEVFTYACAQLSFEDSGIWEWNGGLTDDNENIIEYCLDDENKIQFTVMPEYQGFEVSTLIVKGKTLTIASEAKKVIDMIYDTYDKAYPDKGIVVDTSLENNSLKGTKGPVKVLENGVLYDLDLGDYLEVSIEELNEKGFNLVGGNGVYDEKDIASIMTDDNNIISDIMLNGIRNLSPSLFGIRIGDNKDETMKKLEGKYSVSREYKGKGLVGTSKAMVLEEIETKNLLTLVYHLETEKISIINYKIDTSVTDTSVTDTMKENSIEVEQKIKPKKNVAEEKDYQFLLGDWTNDLSEGGGFTITFTKVDGSNVVFDIISTITSEYVTKIVDIEGIIIDNKINFTYSDDGLGSSGEGVIELEVDPEIKYMRDLVIEENAIRDNAIGNMNTEKVSLWNIQLAESLGVVGG